MHHHMSTQDWTAGGNSSSSTTPICTPIIAPNLVLITLLTASVLATDAKVYVAVYNTIHELDPNHWAIYIDDPATGPTIHQVYDDGTKYYVPEVVEKKPDSSAKLNHQCLVATLAPGKVAAARSLFQAHKCNNVSGKWNCQAWVEEALRAADSAGLLHFDSHAEKCLKYTRQHWQR
ncbi:hypothetical protein ANO11243_066920 [Dothideomycetidae sp. 11243]|nr:hypothetical protein ANO11243_066920 [fungal sp. No.11243]